jgi:uncharacterized membrane protein
VAAALTAIALVWTLVIVIAPMWASHGRLPWLTLAAYQIGSLICHQRPERSFHLAGVAMPVCARCFGLYFAGAAGLALAWILRRRWPPAVVKTALAFGAAPIALTVALEWLGALDTSNILRMMTGLPLGFVAGFAIVAVLRGPD